MSKETLKKLLADSAADAPVYGNGGLLARNFRRVLLARKVDETKWNELMEKYIAFELKGLPPDANRDAQAAAIRGNLTIELSRPTMTWNVYIKGLRLLGLTIVDFCVVGSGDDFKLDPVMTRVQWNNLSSVPEDASEE